MAELVQITFTMPERGKGGLALNPMKLKLIRFKKSFFCRGPGQGHGKLRWEQAFKNGAHAGVGCKDEGLSTYKAKTRQEVLTSCKGKAAE